MRLQFGPTQRERDYANRGWRWWFAWYPVRLAWLTGRSNRGGAWLEWVAYRKKEPSDSIYENESAYEYRPPNETSLVEKTEVVSQ